MSLRRAIGSLLSRSFSPRALLSRAARSHHTKSLRDLTLSNVLDGAAVFTAAALAGAGGTLAVQYFRKGSDDEELAARKDEQDIKARFEDWTKKKNKSYQSEEGKPMQFQLFKDTVDRFLPLEEAYPHGILWRRQGSKDLRAKYEKGEQQVWKPAVKQGDTRATQASA